MKRFMLFLIRFFKRRISPNTPPACRYIPTCSEYARTAVERFGPARGSVMAAKRILRCNPLSKGGYDPVPQGPSMTIRRDENP